MRTPPANRPVRPPPFPQRPYRQLPLSLRPGGHEAALQRTAPTLPHQPGRAGSGWRPRLLGADSRFSTSSLIEEGHCSSRRGQGQSRQAPSPERDRLDRKPGHRPLCRTSSSKAAVPRSARSAHFGFAAVSDLHPPASQTHKRTVRRRPMPSAKASGGRRGTSEGCPRQWPAG